MTTTTRLAQISNEIQAIKQELSTLGCLRPGNLTRQYRDRVGQRGAYYQLSYTRHGAGHTTHVRAEEVTVVEAQLAAYRRLRKLVEQWIDLGLEASRLLLQDSRNAVQE